MKPKLFIPFIFLLTFFHSCYYPENMFKVKIENDNVKKIKRYLFSSNYAVKEWNYDVISLNKTFFKEIKENNEISVMIKDKIILNTSSDDLEQNVFIITDSNIYKIPIEFMQLKYNRNIDTREEEILKIDSTKVNVITEYKENHSKTYNFTYALSDEIRKDILQTKTLQFRYYAGIKMITIKIKDYKLKNAKEVVMF